MLLVAGAPASAADSQPTATTSGPAKAAKPAQRTLVIEAPVIEREPDPQNPDREIWKASGGVTVTSEEMSFKSKELTALASKKGGVEQVHATGSVIIKGSRKTKEGIEQRFDATSDEAVYFISERRLILSGNVRGTLAEVERERSWDLTSQRAQLWLDEDRLRLESAIVKMTMPEKTEKTGSK
jgi:lipopolysaccharide export system protein LptA